MIPRGHPFREAAHHTVVQIRKKLRKWYGVIDADAWYALERQRIQDECADDPLGILAHETIDSYWETRQLRLKWTEERAA